MSIKNKTEVWLRGALPDIPALLQPVGHALLQAREELNDFMQGFSDSLLWEKPANMAAPGFHLKHLTGVLDRLFTYARGEMLNNEQLLYLKQEEIPDEHLNPTIVLVNKFNTQVDRAITQLATTDPAILTAFRGVGRAQLPSTVIGLLFHAAEHTQRHIGQLMVTIKSIQQ
jgi:hypothetical protein